MKRPFKLTEVSISTKSESKEEKIIEVSTAEALKRQSARRSQIVRSGGGQEVIIGGQSAKIKEVSFRPDGRVGKVVADVMTPLGSLAEIGIEYGSRVDNSRKKIKTISITGMEKAVYEPARRIGEAFARSNKALESQVGSSKVAPPKPRGLIEGRS